MTDQLHTRRPIIPPEHTSHTGPCQFAIWIVNTALPSAAGKASAAAHPAPAGRHESGDKALTPRVNQTAVREHGLRTQAAPRTGSAFSEPRKARPLAAPDGQTSPRWTWVGGDGGAAQGQQPAGQDQSLEWREPNIYATRHGFSKVASIAHPAVRP